MDLKKHISKDIWLVKALAGAAIAGSAYLYLKGMSPADLVALIA